MKFNFTVFRNKNQVNIIPFNKSGINTMSIATFHISRPQGAQIKSLNMVADRNSVTDFTDVGRDLKRRLTDAHVKSRFCVGLVITRVIRQHERTKVELKWRNELRNKNRTISEIQNDSKKDRYVKLNTSSADFLYTSSLLRQLHTSFGNRFY